MAVRLAEQLELLTNWRRLCAAGLALSRAMTVLGEPRGASAAGRSLVALRRAADEGRNLQASRPLLAELFGEVVAELLAAGEQAGALDEALGAARSFVETQVALRRKVALAVAYPGFVALCGLLLLPLPTLFGEGLAAACWRYYVPAVLLAAAAYGSVRWLARSWRAEGALRLRLEELVEGLPLAGSFFRDLGARLFFGTLACLLRAGASLAAALPSAGRASGSRALAARSVGLGRRADAGTPLTELLAGEPFVGAETLAELRVGEETGDLAAACAAVAARCDDRVAARATALALGAAALLAGGVLLAVVWHVVGFWLTYFRQGTDAGLF